MSGVSSLGPSSRPKSAPLRGSKTAVADHNRTKAQSSLARLPKPPRGRAACRMDAVPGASLLARDREMGTRHDSTHGPVTL